jgi:hypothetical protein
VTPDVTVMISFETGFISRSHRHVFKTFANCKFYSKFILIHLQDGVPHCSSCNCHCVIVFMDEHEAEEFSTR